MFNHIKKKYQSSRQEKKRFTSTNVVVIVVLGIVYYTRIAKTLDTTIQTSCDMCPVKLVQWDEQNRREILKYFDRTPESIQDDVKSIREWLKLQPHLPNMLNDRAIETMLLLNKCSIEKTKQKLDAYYSIRNFIPEFFRHHPLSEEMQEVARTCIWVQNPTLWKGIYRINLNKFMPFDENKLSGEQVISHMFNVVEMRMREDLCLKDVAIVDFKDAKLSQLFMFTPGLLKKMHTIIEKVFSARIDAMHIVHSFPPAFEKFVLLLRSVLGPKLSSRMNFHSNYESLQKIFGREILPKDYGGDGLSLSELVDLQKQKFEEYKELYDNIDRLKSNEKLRPGKPINDEFLGFQGNFKQLSFD